MQKRAASIFAFLILLSAAESPLHAEDGGPIRLTAISPIFSQLVAFSQPVEFVLAFEKPSAGSYIREAVLRGETVERWSQMITVTGAKGMAAASDITPRAVASQMADGYKKVCPDTFQTAPVADLKISGHPAFAAVISCGSVKTQSGTHSETALIVTIEGKNDYYTLQWAERGTAGPPGHRHGHVAPPPGRPEPDPSVPDRSRRESTVSELRKPAVSWLVNLNDTSDPTGAKTRKSG